MTLTAKTLRIAARIVEDDGYPIAATNMRRAAQELETLSAALGSVREDICRGPLNDTLWSGNSPAETTVDFITGTLGDGWSYDEWLASQEPKQNKSVAVVRCVDTPDMFVAAQG